LITGSDDPGIRNLPGADRDPIVPDAAGPYRCRMTTGPPAKRPGTNKFVLLIMKKYRLLGRGLVPLSRRFKGAGATVGIRIDIGAV
jgi:hypothetical protein